MKSWIRHSSRVVFEQKPWLTLESHHLHLPDGREVPEWLWVDSPDFVNVVAVTVEGDFLCFRQTKYAVEGPTLAIVGGYLEEGEDPLESAARELREETGHQAATWQDLGTYAVDGNRGCGKGHFYLATGCTYVGHTESDDLEEQELLTLTREEIRRALLEGRFGVMPWTAAVALALVREEA